MMTWAAQSHQQGQMRPASRVFETSGLKDGENLCFLSNSKIGFFFSEKGFKVRYDPQRVNG